jgi:hypothetical protein
LSLPVYGITETNNKSAADVVKQLGRVILNALVIRAEDLFLPKYIERYIHTLEGSLYKKDYLALLVIIGGHPGGLPVNSKIEKITIAT